MALFNWSGDDTNVWDAANLAAGNDRYVDIITIPVDDTPEYDPPIEVPSDTPSICEIYGLEPYPVGYYDNDGNYCYPE